MYQYPKNILNTAQLLQKWANAGMQINECDNAPEILSRIGYYRLKGYCFHWYNKSKKQFHEGTTFNNLVNLYQFDSKLSRLVFDFLSQIEISLRARLVNALLLHNDALILNDPSMFADKKLFWKNQSTISAEIARSNDVFIQHNYTNYDGAIPLWAVVEVMSFGTLSKVIKNLKTGTEAHRILLQQYKFKSPSGNYVTPSKDMFSSWVQSAAVMRNICAHNSRIYNRAINVFPRLIQSDSISPQPKYSGLYQILLTMKYLRPNDASWNSFSSEISALISEYSSIIDPNRLNFPKDWCNHLNI